LCGDEALARSLSGGRNIHEETVLQKSEMTPEQLAVRRHFVDTLAKAGWDVRGWERAFDADFGLEPEATLELNDDRRSLRCGYFVGRGYLQLDVGDNPEVFDFGIRFYPKGDVAKIVAAVVKMQAALNGRTAPALVKAVRPSCARITRVDAHGEKPLKG
jgi:hypothetical protein